MEEQNDGNQEAGEEEEVDQGPDFNGLSEADIEEKIKGYFKESDVDGSDDIDEDEFMVFMRLLNCNPTQKELHDAWTKYDLDGSGKLSQRECIILAKALYRPPLENIEILRESLQVFEHPEHPGYIDREKLIQVMTRDGYEGLDEEEVTEFVKGFDVDEDGKISLQEMESFFLQVQH